ncbi:hypothetical protein LPJ78_002797 [Coemansia sp. RSA 989]|nr:hypothetical protein BX667DRAFT_120643 [Coemansia mojavensis]KAJ1742705.1 hypothetical protein LPJ68_001676 [Coemansia sp. RSA 1086]KAJ1752466.1 hypothetical protein LPJ79_001213 [Coemansia sp. RSA 1821]KAJ1865309.1 hypothetical protein LPJ78_002797 [Coemansia sp. RSA 989]KAJ1874545.1 hypothetical protein LPJ55_001405 [Coemansia sp. RSA 990]KAJ2673310.1 hypothetical protein IWW42_002320 [Coemansia sp. RSA 1085]
MDENVGALLAIGSEISQVLADDRVSYLYVKHFQAQAAKEVQENERASWPDPVKRVFQGLKDLDIHKQARIYHVASTYYSWPLYERALCMTAPSPSHLCKLVVLENKRWRASPKPAYHKHANSQYYCVLVQYVQAVNMNKLTDFVRSLDDQAVARKHFNFRLANPETSFELTGYSKNGVSPIAMTNGNLPIILCEEITRLQPPVFWLGAGHVDYKLALSVQTFIDVTKCMIADVSDPL